MRFFDGIHRLDPRLRASLSPPKTLERIPAESTAMQPRRAISSQFSPPRVCGGTVRSMTKRADHLLRYGHRHRQMRERVARSVAAGVVRCARCGELIHPDQQWDLDHADGAGPLDYLGASHS